MRSIITKILDDNACIIIKKLRRPYYKIKDIVESEFVFKISLRSYDELIILFYCFFEKFDEINRDETSITLYKYDDLSKPDSVFACMYVRFSP